MVRPQRNRYTVGPLLSLLSVLATLALLEGALRLYNFTHPSIRSREIIQGQQEQNSLRRSFPALAEPHAERVFELRANARQVFEGPEFTIDMAVNSRHLRDVEHSSEKPAGVYRVLALGDSFTFGWGVNVSETWWSRLAEHLSANLSPARAEVVNLGVYMYTFDQQVQRLEHFGLAYQPDLVINGFYYPHVVTISKHRYQQQDSKPWPKILDSTLYVDHVGLLRYGQPLPFEGLRESSLLVDFVTSRLALLQYRASAAGQLNEYELLKDSRAPDFERAWQRTRAAYERLAEVTQRRGIPVLVFMIPRDMQVWPAWKKESVALSREAPFTSRLPQKKFAAICEDLKLECLDLLPQFSAAAAQRPETPLYYRVDVHWTPSGHALASQLIYDHLVHSTLLNRPAGH